ncbi:uncharacterized protein LOC141718065 isoform X2 [Apium graveolens]|uniref:uncharacterized protein LOC141718065 isoform X2 n=1 Tax=Apium graveolens TaxID=4045 RepID=UPI003D7A6486
MFNRWIVFMISLILFAEFSSASAAPPAKLVSQVVSHVVSALFKKLWSLQTDAPVAISGRSLVKFEGGYTVETLFDGSKHGIEPYSVELSPTGDLLVLDSENSNLYKISTPLSQYSRPKLMAGSSEGYYGHIDGKPREARMNHPKGHAVDDRGNIYLADTMNMAIRKISHAGVVTIAGGSRDQGLGHVDGPGEGAKFSSDFDVVYIGSSCSLLVIDRGNQAIREIQLHDDDCSYQHDDHLNLGIAVLAAACFFGYMLALLQRRVASMFSSHPDPRYMENIPSAAHQQPLKPVRPPLISAELEKQGGLFGSLTKPFRGTLPGFRRKQPRHHLQQQYNQQPNRNQSSWPMQESFTIPNKDEPPPFETTDPRNRYPITTNKMEKSRHLKKSRTVYEDWNDDFHQQEQPQQIQQHHYQQLQQHQQHHSSNPQTCYEQKHETNEIVFGAVQEQDGRREAVVIKAVDYGNPSYSNHNIRSRYNYMGFSYGY